MKFPVGARLRHKKGGYYIVTAHARDSETLFPVYVYTSEMDPTKVWTRGYIDMETPGRFEFATRHTAHEVYEKLTQVMEELQAMRETMGVPKALLQSVPAIDVTRIGERDHTPYQVTDAVATKPIRP